MEIQIDLFNSPSTQNVPMLSLSYVLNITINFGLIIISFIQMHAHTELLLYLYMASCVCIQHLPSLSFPFH